MLIKKAVCAEIEYLDANGGSEMDNGADLQSAGLGKFSFTKTSSEGSSEQSLYAPRARRLLAPKYPCIEQDMRLYEKKQAKTERAHLQSKRNKCTVWSS